MSVTVEERTFVRARTQVCPARRESHGGLVLSAVFAQESSSASACSDKARSAIAPSQEAKARARRAEVILPSRFS
jgi:hypothetical protein